MDLADDAHEVASYALIKALEETHFKSEKKGEAAVSAHCSRERLSILPDPIALAVLAHLAQSTSAGGWKQLSRANLLKVLTAARAGGQPRFVLELSKGLYLEATPDRVRSFPGPGLT